MQLVLKRIDKNLPIPEYKTPGAAGLDLYLREEITIQPGETTLAPLNNVVAIPEGMAGIVAGRSSIYKRGVMLPHGVGVIDSDYCGDSDELRVPLYNFTHNAVTLAKGERLVQLILIATPKIEWDEVEQMPGKNRGGFGTTGK